MNRINSVDIRRALRLVAVVLPQLAMTAHGQATGWVQWSSLVGGNDHWYLAVRAAGGITWTDAQQQALNTGGYLATLTSKNENDFVFGHITDDMWEYGRDGVKWLGPWLGGFRPSVGGNWAWVTGESWSYTNWGPGQPDNNGGNVNETKLNFWFSNMAHAYGWNDYQDFLNLDDYGNVRSYIIERDTPPSTLSGKVLFSDYVGVRPGSALVEFRRPGSTSTTSSKLVQLASDGSFAVEAPESAIWDVSIKVQHWLRRTQRLNLQSNLSGTQYRLFNGDVDGDNLVSILDYLSLSAAFESVPGGPGWNPDADLDGDGQVSILDYLILSTNYERSGDD